MAVLAGVAIAIALTVGDRPGAAVGALAIMTAYAVFLALGARRGDSETIALLAGDEQDERRAEIGLRAAAHAGTAVLVTIIGAWLWELARGHDGSPWFWLAALSGIVFASSLAVQSART